MGKVLTLGGKPLEREPPEVSEELVRILKEALSKAETGELQSFVGIGMTNDDAYYRLMVFERGSKIEMYGLLHILTQEFYQSELVDEDE